MPLSIDIETYSSVDLRKAGVHKYAESPDFRILLVGYSTDGGETVKVLDLEHGEDDREFKAMLTDPSLVKTAFNAPFERTCLAAWYHTELPPEQWRCTRVKALTLGLPKSLAGAGKALGLPADKLKDPKGEALIRFFSKPDQKGRRRLPDDSPEKWSSFLEYNAQDVISEAEIYKKLSKFETPKEEQELWNFDQRLNDRGICLDLRLIDSIVNYDALHKEELLDEAKELTGLENPNSRAQSIEWLAAQGLEVESLDEKAREELLSEKDLPGSVRRFLEIKQELGKSSVAKYRSMQAAVSADGRLRGLYQFYGAGRTGRWAGQLVQVHNLARNALPDLDLARNLVLEGDFDLLETLFGSPSKVLSELVRTAFIASEGRRLVISDFSAIEARVIAYIAGEDWTLKAFRAGKDIYCETATMMYHVPVEKHGINGHLRQKGKVAVLACGYGGGVNAMRRMDSSGTIPEDEMALIVKDWRRANPHIVRLWYDVEKAARDAILTGTESRVGMCRFYRRGGLFIELPSGRSLCYPKAQVVGDPKTGRERIEFLGVNSMKKWDTCDTWGGKLVENIVQAIARDCLAIAMMRVEKAGYDIVMHVHDEMIVDVPVEDKDALKTINEIMSMDIPWAPGLPLKGDGFETPYYKKD